MGRQYTERELQAIVQAESQLRAKGLMVDADDGEEAVNVNSERISSYFEVNPSIPLTTQTILAACEQMRGQMRWKSAAQMAYEKEYNALTKDQQNQFGSWWFNQKQTLILEGDQGYENAAQIIGWMKGRTSFDARTLDLAVTNLAGHSRRPIHWAIREQQSSGRPSHKDDGKGLFAKDEVNLSQKDHQKLRQQAAAAAFGKREPTPSTDYQYEAEQIVGRNHAHTEQLRKMFVTEGGNINWEQTYGARRRAAGL